MMKKQSLISIALCAVLLSGCGGTPAATSAAPNTPSATPPATQKSENNEPAAPAAQPSYDIFKKVDANFPVEEYIANEKAKWNIGRDVNFNWYFNFNHHYGTKPWTEYECLAIAKEITGINVTGDVPTGDATEKVQLMISTSSLPDLVTLGFGDNLGQKLIADGLVYCIEDVLKEHEPEFWESLPESLKKANINPADGKVWKLSGVAKADFELKSKKGLGGYGFVVRKDIWQELGSPSIATPEELYNTLKLFKEKYPEMNGKQSIGIGTYEQGEGPLLGLGYAFGVKDIYLDEATQTVSPKEVSPQYVELLVYMNRLKRDGLLDPELFIKDNQQAIESYVTNTFMMPYVYWATDPANSVLHEQTGGYDSAFVAIPPMSATGKPFAAPGGAVGGAIETYISKNCTDVEAAARLFAYGFSPFGTMQINRGTPGKYWQAENGEWFLPDDVQAEYDKDSAGFMTPRGLWDYYALWYPVMPQREGKLTDANRNRHDFDLPNTDPYAYDATCDTFGMRPTPDSPEGICEATKGELIKRERANIIMNAKSEEEARAQAEKLVNDIKAIKDYDLLVQHMTQQYKKNLELFGGPAY